MRYIIIEEYFLLYMSDIKCILNLHKQYETQILSRVIQIYDATKDKTNQNAIEKCN